MAGIGLLNEKSLHASLKEWYAGPGDVLEVPLDGFVIDIVRDGLLVEIQTGSFASIKSKLLKLSRARQIRLVYPIAKEKWIVKPAEDTGRVIRRRSPRKGRLEDLFWEMVSFPQLLTNPNFSLEVLLVREEELRRYDGERRRRWRTKGWVTEERRLLEVVERRLFERPADWQSLLPEGLRSRFTAKGLAEALGIRLQLAQRMVYCLTKAGMTHLTGKQGRANVYEMVGGLDSESAHNIA